MGWFLSHHPGDPVRLSIEGDTLLAWNETGRLAWRHRFPQSPRQPRSRRTLQIADIRGDGGKRVLFSASFPQGDGGPERDELYCFSSEGKLLWRYKPELAFTFGSTRFTGPWLFTDMVISPGEQHQTIWVAVIHWQLRPSFILAIDPDGIASVKFVSAGHICSIAHTLTTSGGYLLAGGVNNEYASAALAIMRDDARPSSSPQTSGSRFECIDGPKGAPDRYFLFPPSEIAVAAGKPYNRVHLIRKVGLTYVVSTDELLPTAEVGFDYHFSTELEPHEVLFGDSYAGWHRRLQAEGLLKHPLATCPHLRRAVDIRRWDPKSGWITAAIPLAGGVKPDAYPNTLP